MPRDAPPRDAPLRADEPRTRVLVIDDEENLRHMVSLVLRRAGYEPVSAGDGFEGLQRLREDDSLAIVICDVRMPRLDGLGFLDRLPEVGRRVHVLVTSAYGSDELALEAMRRGAYDYLSKPFRPDEVLLALRKVEERERLTLENQRLRLAMAGRGLEGLVGESRSIRDLAGTVAKVAAYPSTVLITGESGTGKELLARGLHRASPQKDGPFVAVNCAAIPEALLESELFGHERGAFTGAVRSRAGLFEQAHQGTLLLDEIGELPLALQAKLLRVLEDRRVRKVGSARDLEVEVRVVAATSRDLDAEVAAGRFRTDLLYRINVVHLRVPPLRERREDIPLLVNHFVGEYAARFEKSVRSVSPEAMRLLLDAPWPGNVRQLQHAVERAVLLCDGTDLHARDLPPELASGPHPQLAGLPDFLAPVLAEAEALGLSVKAWGAAVEAALIRRALEEAGGNRVAAARLLDLSVKALRYKARDYGLEDE